MKFNFNNPVVKMYAVVLGIIVVIGVPMAMMEEDSNSRVNVEQVSSVNSEKYGPGY
tara:strand:- start:683 stop:850 length:168 start_codon:yes stop_codon:yes gene_type:complete